MARVAGLFFIMRNPKKTHGSAGTGDCAFQNGHTQVRGALYVHGAALTATWRVSKAFVAIAVVMARLGAVARGDSPRLRDVRHLRGNFVLKHIRAAVRALERRRAHLQRPRVSGVRCGRTPRD